MNEVYCQCCGMPMGESSELYGTEVDGSKRKEYCKYCYENGEITFKGTMEEMMDLSVGPMVEANEGMSEEQARAMMKEFLPTLSYWKK